MRRKEADEQRQHIEQLEKEDAKKTEFFMAASHQLKSPVAIIQWCLQSAMESASMKGMDREMVSKSLVQADAMSHLITDMLHVFKLVNRKGKHQEYAPVDMTNLLNQVLTQYEMMAHKRDIHLVKGPIENLNPVLADEGYLRQALINLVDNAIKYSPEGKKVTVSAREKAGHVEVCVEDQGIGMTPADQQKLFTEFFRSQTARDMTHEGTGLGLVLVKQIVEEFGGKIEVDSKLGKGSSFTLRLPVA